MQSTIPQTETTSNQLEQMLAFIEDFRRLLALKLAATSVKHERVILLRFFTNMNMQKKHYAAVTQQDIESYALANQWKQHMRAHVIFSIRRFYEYLKEKALVDRNPAEFIKIVYPKKRGLVQAPTVAEIRKVFRTLERNTTMQGMRLRLMVELAYGSGMRAGEIAGLDFDDINIAEQTALVLGKGSKERVVPLTRRSLDVLQRYRRGIDATRAPLFVLIKGPHQGQRLTSASVSTTIRTKTGYHAHLYRHACATHMLLNGCNIRYIQEMLGHERCATTQIYTRLRNEELRQVVNQKHPCASRISHTNYMNMKEMHRSH